jgi:hypothetical protein
MLILAGKMFAAGMDGAPTTVGIVDVKTLRAVELGPHPASLH